MRLTEEEYLALTGSGTKPKRLEKKRTPTGVPTSKKKGWREYPNGKRYYMRSLWEMRYGHYLQWLQDNKKIVEWMYEPRTFKFPKEKYKAGPFYYKPDFCVIEKDLSRTWHEVKGYMDAASKKKIKRFRIHNPNETLLIVDAAWFKQAKKSGLYRMFYWETLDE